MPFRGLATGVSALVVVGLVASIAYPGAGPSATSGVGWSEVARLDKVGPDATSAWSERCGSPGSSRARLMVRRGQSLPQLVRAMPAGTLFCITSGVHRLRAAVVPKSGQSFVGEHGAVLSGAVELRGFVRAGKLWVASGQRHFNPSTPGRCQPTAPACVYANDVFVEDKPLRRVLSLSSVTRGRFFVDQDAGRIWIGTDPRGRRVEVSATRQAIRGWESGASNVTIKGLVVEKFANEASIGAIQARDGWTVEGNEIRLNHAIGLQGGDIVVANHIHHNGQLGFTTHGAVGTLFARNEISYNNWADYDWFWEAGGTKFMVTTRLVVRDNFVHHNRSAGMSSDWDNTHTLYVGNRVEDNLGVGIFYEASYDGVIRGNLIRRNGLATRGGLDGAGIGINSSQNVEVVGNRLEGNLHGVGVVASQRAPGRYGEHATRNIHVHGNVTSLAHSIGASGLASDDHADYTTNNNRFEGNSYTYCQPRAFAWKSAAGGGYTYLTSAEWMATGNDRTGTFRLRAEC